MKSTEIRPASQPTGWPTADTFELASLELPPLADGQVLVRNLFMSVDPAMRGHMNDGTSYVPPFQIGKPLEGRAIGEVVQSRATELKTGDFVQSTLDHVCEMAAFLGGVSPLFAVGRLKALETVVPGLENAPQALIDLLRGGNIGKMIVKI